MLKFPKKIKLKKVKGSEKELQNLCEGYLEAQRIAYIRIPDLIYKIVFGGSYVQPHLKAIVSKYFKGLPDLTVLFDSGKYLAIELKTGHHQTPGQKNFERMVGSDNYHIIQTFEDFKELIDREI